MEWWGHKEWGGAGWVFLEFSCQGVMWDPSPLCHQALESAEIQKFYKIPSVFVELWWDWLRAGAWGAHTASAPWDRAWIGSGAALELWHLIKMRIINLQLMVMVTKMWPLKLDTTHPLLLLGEWNEDFYVGRKKPQAPNVTVSELSLCVTKTWQFQLDGLCANEKRISWSAVWRGRDNENQFNLCHYFAFWVGRRWTRHPLQCSSWSFPGLFPGTWISVGKQLWGNIFQTGASSQCSQKFFYSQ